MPTKKARRVQAFMPGVRAPGGARASAPLLFDIVVAGSGGESAG
jgi:hypothetical protein